MGGKNFVVIGGSKGIGMEVTRNLSWNNLNVTVVSRSPGEVDNLPGITHVSLDITAEDLSPASLPDSIQGLVYCPGSINLRPFQRLTEDDFMADLQVNFLGAVKSIQASLKGLRRAAEPPGSIVLFSTVAVKTGMPFHASIGSAKGAVEGLTRSLAAELAPNIRVNAIAPSLTDTGLSAPLLSDEKKREAAAQRHPLKRFGNAKDVAAAAAFMLDESSAWITGQVIPVDGGMSAVRTFR